MADDWLSTAKKKGLIGKTQGVNVAALGRPLPWGQGDELISQYLTTADEAAFQKVVIQVAKNNGWRVAHCRKVLVKTGEGKTHYETPMAEDGKGFLDLEIVKGPWLVKAELKVRPNTTTDEQDLWIEAYKEAGVEVHVWYSDMWAEIRERLTREVRK